jgi:serine/threonine protein phosphatase PrpC
MINIQSRIGGRQENQDFYGTAKTTFGELIVVCDGMGGHNGGRYAAELAVNTILKYIETTLETEPQNALQNAINEANTTIWNEAHANPEFKKMGTTVVALLLTPEKAISCHLGDSRIYQVCNGKILFRTYDHSHVFEMVKAGLITEEQARLSEKSNIITRALGIKSTVEIDITDNLSYQKGDRFMLCTDGICGMIPESELLGMIFEKQNVETVVSNLVEKIDAIGKAHGGKHDNLTAALIEIETNSTLQNTEVQQSGSTNKKRTSRSKQLVYLLLILLLGFMVVNLYFVKQNKPEVIKIEKKIINKQINKTKTQTADSTKTITPIKK